MCGKAYDPRLIVAWPSAKIAVMGGDQAANTLLQIEKSRLNSKGEPISEAEEKELLDRIKGRYENGAKPEFAASRLWVDAIINPLETRKWIEDNNPEITEFVTYSPKTEMARKFHLKNGASTYRENEDSVNYKYD